MLQHIYILTCMSDRFALKGDAWIVAPTFPEAYWLHVVVKSGAIERFLFCLF